MKTLTRAEAMELHWATPFIKGVRRRETTDDWGDQETRGINLKKVELQGRDATAEDFGQYLGAVEGGFLVAVMDWDHGVTSGELFESLEELKQRWEADE